MRRKPHWGGWKRLGYKLTMNLTGNSKARASSWEARGRTPHWAAQLLSHTLERQRPNISRFENQQGLCPETYKFLAIWELDLKGLIYLDSLGPLQRQLMTPKPKVKEDHLLILKHLGGLLLFSHQVMSCSLRPHGLQHSRPPCPSPSPRACSNSRPLSRWCHPTFSSSVVPFFFSSAKSLF